jgi:hypothetical protein
MKMDYTSDRFLTSSRHPFSEKVDYEVPGIDRFGACSLGLAARSR